MRGQEARRHGDKEELARRRNKSIHMMGIFSDTGFESERERGSG